MFIHIAIEPVNKSLSLLAGGALMVVASGVLGEWATFDAGSVSSRSLLAWGYLLVFGRSSASPPITISGKKTKDQREDERGSHVRGQRDDGDNYTTGFVPQRHRNHTKFP
ncbi:MAG: hypothetical protein H0T63_00340 [Pyrinomonadaceae bacterium]|nr:hypothetical protein [Pyrinomonadaceae bacterium]